MNKKKLLIALLIGAVGSGCSVKVSPLKPDELRQRANRDRQQMFVQQEPVTGPITLQEAIARALKYNLDHRVKLVEIAVAERILDVSNYNMLPELALAAGYNTRNNDSGGSSQSLLTGKESLEPSTSQERNYYDANLDLVWNVLDFGVSYATAEQRANEIMVARERRRRVIQNIVRDIYNAYWRAVGAQRLIAPTNEILQKTKSAMERSQSLGGQALQNPETALVYQKRLLETWRDLRKLREEMEMAKSQLAALMNLPIGTQYEVAIPKEYRVPEISMSVDELESFALVNQPELLQEDYSERIDRLEVKKAFLRMFPGLEISAGLNYNSNKFLYNKDWVGAGLQVSWNLLNVFLGGPAAQREAEAHVALGEHRRMALSMAVLTQVWVGYQRYQLAKEDFELMRKLSDVNDQLGTLAASAQKASARNELDVILIEASTLAARMGRELSYAELHAAWAQVYHAVGLDPLPDNLTTHEAASTDRSYLHDAQDTQVLPNLQAISQEMIKQMQKYDQPQ